MKPIGHVVNQLPPRSTSPAPARSTRTEEGQNYWRGQPIDRLFVRLQQIYGHRWSSQFGTGAHVAKAHQAAKAEWAQSLDGIHVDAVAQALEAMKREYVDWPPTLPQFLQLCRPQSAPYHKPAPRLLEAPRNPEVARAALAECRRILGRGAPADGT